MTTILNGKVTIKYLLLTENIIALDIAILNNNRLMLNIITIILIHLFHIMSVILLVAFIITTYSRTFLVETNRL